MGGGGGGGRLGYILVVVVNSIKILLPKTRVHLDFIKMSSFFSVW